MIVKILSSASIDFNGINYNDKKIDNGEGELMSMKNFPASIDEDSSKEDIKNYLKAISKNSKTKKPQFHAVISTKYRNHSKEELKQVAELFMKEIGYQNQPYISVFHGDTENNHIHIVSTRVDKISGKKIDDSFERLKSQEALNNVLTKLYGENYQLILAKLLQYRYSNSSQLETLLKRNGFDVRKKESEFQILKNGNLQEKLKLNDLKPKVENENDIKRKKQLKAIFYKYRNQFSNNVFKVVDDRDKTDKNIKIEFQSEFQFMMKKKFGIDIVFHNSNNKNPFGYSIIDNKSKTIFKGSEIMKMNELFSFKNTDNDIIDKRTFESLSDYHIPNAESKKILLEHFNKNKNTNIKDYMLFTNFKKYNQIEFEAFKQDVKDSLFKRKSNPNIHFYKDGNGVQYVLNENEHFVLKLNLLVNKEELYREQQEVGKSEGSFEDFIDEVLFKMEHTGIGGAIEEFDKKRKKKRKK